MSNITNMLLEVANHYTKEALVEQLEEVCKEYRLVPTDEKFNAVVATSTLISMKQAIDELGMNKVKTKVKESEAASRMFNVGMN